jgi:hypothetical protein
MELPKQLFPRRPNFIVNLPIKQQWMGLPKLLFACWTDLVLSLPKQQLLGLSIELFACGTGFKQCGISPHLRLIQQPRCQLFACCSRFVVGGANPFIIVTAPLLD